MPNDFVCTDDDLSGTIVRIDGPFALVDIGAAAPIWLERAKLMQGDPPSSTLDSTPTAHATTAALSPAHYADAGGRLSRWANGIWLARRTVIWGWVVIVLACAPLAATAESAFVNGGFLIQDGEAIGVLEEMQHEFRMPVGQQVVIVPGPMKEAAERIDAARGPLFETPHVLAISEPRASKRDDLVAVTIFFSAPDDISIDSYEQIREAFQSAGFAQSDVAVAGTTATFADTNAQTKRDLKRAELIGTPLALIVLLLVFGSAVAAIVPVLVGIASVVVTLALLHLLSLPLELSIFVMNIASMLGFGLGIDYSLLGVSRFREELARGEDVQRATLTTITSSGRAAAISGIAVLVGVAALAAIPLPVMWSIAIGGVVVVAVTVLASLTLLPAMLAVLGHRIERWRIRAPHDSDESIERSRWYRMAHAVMRRPGLSIFGSITLLLLLASPILQARVDVPHEEILPASSPSRQAAQTLKASFDERVESPVIVVVDSADPTQVDAVRAQLENVERITNTKVIATDTERQRTLVNAYGDDTMGAGGEVSRAVARDVLQLDTPVDIEVSGQGAGEIEFLNVVRAGMPKTLILMFISTIIVLTIAFRSVTLPLKAVALDTLSILAALGCVVAVFQNGFGIELLGAEPLGYTDATIPIILFCLLFGLSMDYEVFMLAKVTELYQAGYDDQEATARGVATTAPLVTGAALVLIVIGIAFSLTELVLVKQIGFGMAVALALDATVVRVLLLPATMRWLGPANWWLPKPLQRRIPHANWAH